MSLHLSCHKSTCSCLLDVTTKLNNVHAAEMPYPLLRVSMMPCLSLADTAFQIYDQRPSNLSAELTV